MSPTKKVRDATWCRPRWCAPGCGTPWPGSMRGSRNWPAPWPPMAGVPPPICWPACPKTTGRRLRVSSSSPPEGHAADFDKMRYINRYEDLNMTKAVLYDSTLCVGCKACEGACAERWGLPYDEKIAAEEKLSAHKLTAIETHGERYTRRLCMHCEQPTCVSVCPVGALQKTALGPVTYDASKCMGCRYCMTACPFQVPSYEWSSRLPKVRKCDQCYERQSKGEPTACSAACPTGATTSGDREALVAEAQKRIA